ncbi:MAG: YbaK/EbsC family protein [bacterium]
MIDVEDFLKTNSIEYILHEHKAVFTTNEANEINDIPGLQCKNLFLKTKKGDRFYLVILPANEKLDLKNFGNQIIQSKLTFGSKEELKNSLGVEAGSVSPFGLLNDKLHIVNVYVSKLVMDADIVGFHPNRNTATLELTRKMFSKYLNLIENPINVI